MAVKITQFENTKKKTGFNVDVDAKFVSLVQHGANQKAFKIIKNDKGGKMQEKFIQSVVLRKNVKLDDITSIKGLEYLAEVKDCDVKKTEDYSVFTQIDANKMKDLQLSKVEDKAFIIFGDLSEEVDVDQSKLLTLSKEQMEKIEKGEFPTPKAYEWNPSVSSMFFDSFDRELFAMVDIIEGTLRQANIPPATMKKTILGAISAFQSFMSMAIDSLNSNSSGDKVAKFEKVENVSKLLKNKFIDKNTQEKGGNQMFTFENKEDFEKAVDERMLEILKKAKEAEKEIEKETEVMKSEEKKKEEKSTVPQEEPGGGHEGCPDQGCESGRGRIHRTRRH